MNEHGQENEALRSNLDALWQVDAVDQKDSTHPSDSLPPELPSPSESDRQPTGGRQIHSDVGLCGTL